MTRILHSHRTKPWLNLSRSFVILLIVSFVLPGFQVQAHSPQLTSKEQAIDILEQMTPEERVGQLFLLTFQGTDTSPESQIFDLITNYHIGGVVLLSENDNFIYDGESGNSTIETTIQINRQLQQNTWDATRQTQVNPATGENFTPEYIPLFIGIIQEGDGFPYDQILHGLTTLPNAMTLGATWNPETPAQVGAILGKQLSTLGINLLLGPTLDVLESPQTEGTNDLGTRTFGGDPYWVSQMGSAYIKGLHEGSENKIAVVAKHFPGHGSSDRLPEDEVATVRKTLDELESFDLVPFYNVTGNAQSVEETTDALLVSHIRYQGLQGNIRATTRPISFDPQALNLLMELPVLNTWRQSGGVMVSDNLGSPAVRRFYDLTSQEFDPRRVALNAFLAGNDLLYIADFSSGENSDPFLNTTRNLEFFAQKYREDTAFAQRVDESVLRILTLKYRLYANFTISGVIPGTEPTFDIETSGQVTFEAARQSATLISPTQAELDDTIPDPPNQNDRIVFLSDTRTAQQCSQCPLTPMLDKNGLQEAVLRLYGPQAGGQVTINRLASYALGDLESMLDHTLDEDNQIERDLSRANWIVFTMLAARSDIPSFQTLSRFLAQRPDLIQQKRVIVFALCAPYYLDATNISKLTAYYGLYSKTEQFVDTAAYLLFRELLPEGAPPVSVPGISYDLNKALFPDPDQIIPLELDLPQSETSDSPETPEPPPAPEFRIGDVIPVRTGIILDHNGHHVPDGTPVSFEFTIGGEGGGVTKQIETSIGGIARTTFPVTAAGTLEIYAESENAQSEVLKFDIPLPSGEIITTTPTEEPTTAPTMAPTAPTATTQSPPITTPNLPASSRPNLSDWILVVFFSSLIAWAVYRLAALAGYVRWGVRAGFLVVIGGLLAYSYMAFQISGSQPLLGESASINLFLGAIAGGFLGLLITLLWRVISESSHRHPTEKEET